MVECLAVSFAVADEMAGTGSSDVTRINKVVLSDSLEIAFFLPVDSCTIVCHAAAAYSSCFVSASCSDLS